MCRSEARGWGNDTADHERDSQAAEAWTDGRHAADDNFDELDYELAVALFNVTECAARSTVLKITQGEPSHGFVAWQALVDGLRPRHRTTQQPGCKEAKKLKDKLTAWSLKVAEYKHQFNVIERTQSGG